MYRERNHVEMIFFFVSQKKMHFKLKDHKINAQN